MSLYLHEQWCLPTAVTSNVPARATQNPNARITKKTAIVARTLLEVVIFYVQIVQRDSFMLLSTTMRQRQICDRLLFIYIYGKKKTS